MPLPNRFHFAFKDISSEKFWNFKCHYVNIMIIGISVSLFFFLFCRSFFSLLFILFEYQTKENIIIEAKNIIINLWKETPHPTLGFRCIHSVVACQINRCHCYKSLQKNVQMLSRTNDILIWDVDNKHEFYCMKAAPRHTQKDRGAARWLQIKENRGRINVK